MSELDAEIRSDAAKSIVRLRRLLLRCQLGLLGVPLVMAPILIACEKLGPSALGILFVAFFLAAGACLLVGNAAWLQLIAIRCPRCGKAFTAAFGFGHLRARCQHCGLDLGPGAIGKSKSADESDLLE
jgi:hypothetical protein